jgi:hypothetical protein
MKQCTVGTELCGTLVVVTARRWRTLCIHLRQQCGLHKGGRQTFVGVDLCHVFVTCDIVDAFLC